MVDELTAELTSVASGTHTDEPIDLVLHVDTREEVSILAWTLH